MDKNTQCPFCSYKSQKCNVIKHLRKQKRCNPDIPIEQYFYAEKNLLENRYFNENNEEILEPFKCEYCNRSFKGLGYLNNHLTKNCPNKKFKDFELLKQELNLVKNNNEQLTTYIKTISENLDVIASKELTSSETHSNSHNDNSHNDNTHNEHSHNNNGTINNGVIINNYHDTKDYDFISDKLILKLISEFRNNFLEELLRLNHFNPQLPNLQNIRLTPSDYKTGVIQIFENDKWKRVRIETIIPEKTDFLVLRSINAIDAMKDPESNLEPELKPTEKNTIEKAENFLNTVDVNGDNFDKKNYDNLVTDMKLTVLNNTT